MHCLLKATREQPFTLKITKIANPVVGDTIMETDSYAKLKKSLRPRRNKKTAPKPQELESIDAMDVSILQEATPFKDNSPNLSFAPPELTGGIRSSTNQESDDELQKELSCNMENYRRFSSRVRKMPEFFGIGGAMSRIAGLKRKRDGTMVKRRLDFDALHAEKVAVELMKLDSQETLDIQEKPGSQEKPDYREKSDYQEKSDSRENTDSGDTGNANEQMETPEEQRLEKAEETKETLELENAAAKPPNSLGELKELYPLGTMVWGKLPGYDWWPGNVISYDEEERGREKEGGERGTEPQVWIKWFGENQLSQISGDRLTWFDQFLEHYHPMSMKGMYKKALIAALKEAAKRCKVEFLSRPDDKKPRWVITESCPEPHLLVEGVGESEESTAAIEKGNTADLKTVNTESDAPPSSSHETESEIDKESNKDSEKEIEKDSERNKEKEREKGARGRKGRSGRERGTILLSALEQEMVEWALKGFLPAGPEGLKPSPEHNVQIRVVPVPGSGMVEEVGGSMSEEEHPRKKAKVMLLQIRRKARFDSVLEGKLRISDLCIGCGDMDIVAEHPLFHGGLCKECKDSFMEYAYLFDDDGTQMYCTICSGGDEVFMCDAENCAKVYCAPCVEKLCGIAEVERVRAAGQWLCYMCSPEHWKVGLLSRRQNWDKKLQELFMNDHEMEYDLPPFYPPIPAEERRPIRVLGLFDGIATGRSAVDCAIISPNLQGLLVLKELGMEVEKYIASEIDPDAIKVSRVQHKDIIHIGDIARITEKEIKAWGPFDMVMGGSPCNDLSIVNPARKGIYEGTGRLFFEFFRLMTYAKPAPGEDRPFFWLYENVVSMRAQDKQTISRFLQCNPVVVDAKEISAAHRARYFWGNLPGMNRPTTPLPGDRLTLQECLEPNCFRTAQFTKLRTITTKMNSIKQTKKAIYPVMVDGEEQEGDVLWCTEMERLFGFPDHYTDVANLGRCGRQRLLGKAWSVPVMRHIFSPLKDYFQSSTTKEGLLNDSSSK